ncbi:MAG TPA: hypothetical protein VII86_00555 [Thermoanaerobaculia bacterium]|jgi:hypothetical protein
MRSRRNVILGVALGSLVVAGALWAEGARLSLPIIRSGHKAQQGNQKALMSSVSQTIIDNIDHYDPTDPQRYYHAKVTDPGVSWQEKCQLAIRHGRLALLSTDAGGNLGGTREHGSSVLHVRVLCPEEIAAFDVPADFVVDTAPHPEELGPMSFDTDMYSIEGTVTDTPLFASFHLTGGTANGFKSPGHTSLIPESDGSYAIDSTFNVGYHLDFVGAKGGPLEGASGTADASVLMKAVGK